MKKFLAVCLIAIAFILCFVSAQARPKFDFPVMGIMPEDTFEGAAEKLLSYFPNISLYETVLNGFPAIGGPLELFGSEYMIVVFPDIFGSTERVGAIVISKRFGLEEEDKKEWALAYNEFRTTGIFMFGNPRDEKSCIDPGGANSDRKKLVDTNGWVPVDEILKSYDGKSNYFTCWEENNVYLRSFKEENEINFTFTVTYN